MYRTLIEDLKKWKNSRHRKPLILQGARQTGKTWLMKEFGRTEYKNTAYLFCQENPTLEALFDAPFETQFASFKVISTGSSRRASPAHRVLRCKTRPNDIKL